MKYEIVYDKPGRLRIRLGLYAFTKEEGYGIEAMLGKLSGVSQVESTSANGGLLIRYEEGSRAEILSLVGRLDRSNLPVETCTDEQQKRETRAEFINDIVRMTAQHYAVRLFLPVPVRTVFTVIRSIPFFVRGIRALSKGKLSVEVLDAASITAAYIQKTPATAASVMFLLGISDRLERFTRKQTRDALAESLAMNIDTVWQVTEAGDVRVPLAQIQPGDRVRVQAGALMPADGVIAEGDGMINEASLTGEAAPVHKDVGKTVFAGTAVQEGNIIVEVTKTASESRIAGIVNMIDASELMKAGAQSRAEKLADTIVPFSFLTSLAVGLVTRNLAKALSVLMVDYSCAVRLSTPICVISAMGEASRRNTVIKGGRYLEALARADTVVFDKTGTLTCARPTVTCVLPFGDADEEKLLCYAACIEEHFPHSVARAIVEEARARGLHHENELHAEVDYVVAHGIKTKVNGHDACIGSAHFIFEDEGVKRPPRMRQRISKAAPGSSVVYLAIDGVLEGAICLDDELRPEAHSVLKQLREAGIGHIVMLTGDSEAGAAAVAERLGIDEVHA
ncbi:MAG: heavy metal translocating P-type ATPase, partial [Ruminococcaceae bacterium]|nr:heavy metal translocating P-type ATPase [Oscillospiraceae bacterium]